MCRGWCTIVCDNLWDNSFPLLKTILPLSSLYTMYLCCQIYNVIVVQSRKDGSRTEGLIVVVLSKDLKYYYFDKREIVVIWGTFFYVLLQAYILLLQAHIFN